MDIDYGPALPPRLDCHSRVDDASGINVSSVEEPSRLPSAQPKKSSHSFKQYVVARALPRTTTLIILMNLGLHLAEPRKVLINLNTNLGPDIYLLPQRRISPLRPDIGLQNLLGRPTLIKTILNMTQILLTTGK